MKYISSISGGVASAVATHRAIERYGKENLILWFADTLWEDEDLYRFLSDLEEMWEMKIARYVDGRTPLEIAEHKKIIPNQKIAPCSEYLKIRPFRKYIEGLDKPITVLLGMDWSEQHRMIAPKKSYESIQGVKVDFPLMWKPIEFMPYHQVVKEWGIEPPRLYQYGFSHNNCGGRCVRQGIQQWRILMNEFPERFAEVRDWEEANRVEGTPRENYAILRDQSGGTVTPLTLKELEDSLGPQEGEPTQEDMFSCFCSY